MAEPRIPRVASGVDVRQLPLSPHQGYVFSRVDGKSTERDISAVTGIPEPRVVEIIDRLIELGALAVGEEKKQVVRVTEREDVVAGNMMLGGVAAAANAPVMFKPSELEEPVDLTETKKKQILNAYYALDKLNFYELLGLHQLVEKKEIKAAYYQVAPDFHPDKFFRKKLGSFQVKIEAIFGKLTEAHDTLTIRAKRDEYDAYLLTAQDNQMASELLSSTERALNKARAEIEAAAQAANASTQADARTMAARRQVLAAKMRGASMGRRSTTPPPNMAAIDPRAAAEALRHRYEAARADAQKKQIERYVQTGRVALADKDWAGASNAFRIAMGLSPDDQDIQEEGAEAIRRAAAALADGFMRQAEYEANQERWPEASTSFMKVCQGRPDDAKAHDRAAYALMKADGDHRRAVEYARRAIELAPKQPVYRVTLAHIYMAAEMGTSAESELARAKELGAGEPKIEALIKLTKEAWEKGNTAGPPSRKGLTTPPVGIPKKNG